MPKRLAMVLTVLFTLAVGSMWGAEETVTISFATVNQRVSQTTSQQVWKNGDVTFTNNKASSTSNVADYSNPVRLYKSSSITITSPKNITKIVATASSSSYATALKNSINSGASLSGSVVTITPSSSSTTYTIEKLSDQVRLISISVTFEVAASCDKKVTLTKGSEDDGTFTLDKTNGSYDNCDADFVVKVSNVQPTSSSQYCSGINVTGENSTVTGPVDGVWTVTYAKENNITSTITPTFANKTAASITFENMGTPTPTTTGYYVGDIYTLPSKNNFTCGTKTFVGWSTVTIDNSAAKPTTNFYEPGASVTLAANNTFYAVFATTSGSGASGDYELVTSAPDDWSGTYLIVDGTSKNCFDGSLKTLDANRNYKSVTITNNKITSTATTDSYSVSISKSTTSEQYYIQTSSGYYIGSDAANSSASNELDASTTQKYDNSISISSNNVTIKGPDHILKFFYQTNSEWRFRFYKSTTTQNVRLPQLYRKAGGISYSDYTTQCTTETTVTLNPNGGTGNVSTETTEETIYTVPDCSFTRTGYTFEKWNTKEDGTGTDYEPNDEITLDGTAVDLYAIWTPIKYEVQFDANGGTGTMENQTFTYDQTQQLTKNTFTRVGFEFAGWNEEDDGSGEGYTDQQEVSNLTTKNGNVYTLYAQWECVTPTISTQPKSATYIQDDVATGLSVVATAADATLSYQWQSSTDNSNWSNINGAISATYKPSTQSVGTTYYQVVVTNSEGNCSATSDLVTITVRSANCKWVETEIENISSEDEVLITMKRADNGNTYTLDHSQGTSKLPPAQIIAINGNEATFLSLYHSNSIWNISGNPTDGYILYPNGSTTTWLYCTKSNKNVKVGGTTSNVFTIDQGYLKHTNTTELWIAYLGVYINGASTVWHHENLPTAQSIVNQTLKFYKKECLLLGEYWINYELTDVECTDNPIINKISTSGANVVLNFQSVGQHNELPSTITVKNSATTLAVNTDYTWSNGALTILKPSQITDNITITIAAQKRKYTVTFDANGHGTAPATQTITAEEKATEPNAPETEGYTFGGWYTDAACTNAFDFNTAIVGNTTLYAKWTVNSYTVTWDPNGGNWGGSTENKVDTYEYGASITQPENPTREGYQFDGWGTVATTMPAENLEYTAQWTPIYTITWVANGQSHYTQTAEEGTALEMPSAPDVNDYDACKDKVFVGWTANPISGSTDDEPADLFTTKTAKVEDAATTYYAVFATADGGGTENVEATLSFADKAQRTSYSTSKQVWEQNGITLTNDKASSTSDVGDYANPARFYKSSDITIEAPGNITQIEFNCSESKYTTSIAGFSADGTTITVTQDGTSTTFSTNLSEGQVRLNSLVVTYTTSGGTSYSDYTTSCVALPDPVISFVTTPEDPIVFDPVNCGSNSTKAQAKTVQVNGENLQDHVTVEVTGPYKIARTSYTNLSDYTTSLTLDKTTKGAIDSDYQTVYIISTPPAQSTDATTGTLTFTTKKGNTLTVNLSTPTVNCTTYALTFNDRGNKTVENYYAGEEVPQPVDPTGVCTEPIHYVFDGWAEAKVDEGSTTYTKVSFPYTMPAKATTLYAVYRYVEDGSADSGDYVKLTEDLDDYSGDYLIVYETGNVAFDGGLNELDEAANTISVTINSNTIESNATTDAAKFTIAKVDGGYSIQSASGYYIGWGGEKNGLNTNSSYTVSYLNTITDKSTICGKTGYLKFNKTSGQERFRYYQSGQETIALYRKAASYLYTTSPVCGPHLAITEGKDIYVTGGNAGGTRDLVIAQQKVSYKATRLEKDKSTGNLPSIKVLPSNITYDSNKTKAVTITFDEDSVRTLQSDGTYTISGTMTISYQPKANNVTDDIQVVLNANYNPSADVSNASFTIHARSLPQEFVIVAKQGDKWYALNGDMSNGSSANPANGQITLDDATNPTKATYAPCNTIYTFDGLPNTGDRKFVRFQGTDGAWLWAASGTNVGIQNKSLKNTPSGNMEESKPYNWEIETENNITYFFHNANSSRVLRLNDGKFGMYVSGTDVIRILPYEAKCLYNYAPSNLKVSELKSTYVTLVWDAVAGATKYQYSTDATNWTDAGSESTVTINGLTRETNYTYYIRAYHADSGVSQECFDYSEVTFTTANCDDVPTDIIYTADLNSITVSWTASATTATVKLYSDEAGTTTIKTQDGKSSPYKFTDLTKNTTYYVQILAGGTCASPIIPVKTENVKVDIVEWQPQGIVVDINTNETVGVTLENEVSYGSGTGADATELFFSKYYEATGNVKLVAIYNGTKNIIDLTDYEIHYGKDSWESQHITLKDFGETKGQIQPGEELILYTTNESDDDNKILDCVNKEYPDGKWVRVTQTNNEGKGHLSFAGNKTLVLKKAEEIIDVIGALTSAGNPTSTKAKDTPSWGDDKGWNCAEGLSIKDNSQIGISTNRCLLVRNNTITSGANAVASNIDDFVTLCSEWKGAQVPDDDDDNGVAASCENFAYVGTFDYSDYYTQFESMGEEIVFEENNRKPDGTVNVPITDLYKQSCRNIRITLEDKDGNVLTDQEYKVPIMITTTQGTDGQTFLDLQQNLATIEVKNGDTIYHPLSLDEVREICKTCDVVIRDNATLTKMDDDAANDHPQVHDVYVYENSSLVVPNGTNYTINNLSLRRKGDDVASLNVYPGALKLPESAAAPISLDVRVDAQNWHWFTLPYNCNISDVKWIDGSPAQYNVDWFLMTYDGESRSKEQSHYENHWKQYFGTTIEAGKGYIVGITGDLENPAFTYELRFPMAKEVLAYETTDKTVDVRAWGVEEDIRPNKKGWNLIGNPYLAYYQRDNVNSFGGLRLGELIGPDPQTGLWEQTGNLPYVVVPVEGGWVSYEQLLVSETDLLPFTAYFVQVGNDGTHTSEQELSISFDHTKLQLSSTPMPASLIQRTDEEIDGKQEPVIVGVTLSNSLGESDKTSLVIDKQYTDEYEMNADFFKWFGDYYTYYTKPVLYTIGADKEKRAFNALSKELANQPIAMGMYAAKAGEYTFTLDLRSDLSRVEEVWLHDATENIYTNLLQDSYTFSTSKVNGEGRFFLSVKMKPAQEPEPDPTPDPDPTPEPDPTPDPEPDPNQGTNLDNIATNQVWATVKDNVIYVNGLLSSAQLWIYDAAGKLLHQDQTQYYQHTYIVPQGGAYFVRVQSTMQTQTIKVVVKQH